MEGKKKAMWSVGGGFGGFGGVWKVFPFYFIHQSGYGDVFRVNPGSHELRVDIILHPQKKKIPTQTDGRTPTRGTLVRVDMLKTFQPRIISKGKYWVHRGYDVCSILFLFFLTIFFSAFRWAGKGGGADDVVFLGCLRVRGGSFFSIQSEVS